MDVVRQTLSVVLVFVVLGIALWVLRRAGGAVSLRRSLGLGRASDRARAIETVERLWCAGTDASCWSRHTHRAARFWANARG